METKNPLIDRSTWTRLLYMVLFAFVFQIVELSLAILAIVQILAKLFTGEAFKELGSLGGKLASYARDIGSFLTFHSDDLPFPFAESRSVPFRSDEPVDQGASG